jgi:hypothetical protein
MAREAAADTPGVMTNSLFISLTPATTVLAVACVVVGGPWFADGLRALRARRALRALPPEAGNELHPGPLHVHGRVVLESPMFAPLSGRPCARWELHVRDARGMFVGRVAEERDFLLETEAGVAQVTTGAEWRLAITDERAYASTSELSENLSAQLERAPELRWLKARGSSVIIVERALFAGSEAHVLGAGLRGAVQWHERTELARTGTDDVAWEESLVEPETEWHIGPCNDLEHCIVSDRALAPRRLAPPAWRANGAILGPALALAGLLELADAAGRGVGGSL